MSVKLIFEDNGRTPSSVLLKSSLYENHIYFSGGCSRLLDKIDEVLKYRDTEGIYVFFDVPPDNSIAIEKYYQLIDEIISCNDYDCVKVIPIICIEYFICKMLFQYKYFPELNDFINELVQYSVEKMNYSGIRESYQKYRKYNVEYKSLERNYKYIVNSQILKCMHNRFEYESDGQTKKDSISGIFYSGDCNCPKIHCYIGCEDKIELKAERLFALLPIFITEYPAECASETVCWGIDDDVREKTLSEFGTRIMTMTDESIRRECLNFYSDICKQIGIPTINIVV